jgi:Fe-S-cluster containining protein
MGKFSIGFSMLRSQEKLPKHKSGGRCRKEDFNMNKKPETNCECDICKSRCRRRVGWFLPEQVSKIEEFFNKNISEMIGKELVIDYWASDDLILILAPNIIGNHNKQMPFKAFGQCVFLDPQEKCRIYSNRPYECACADHNTDKNETTHEQIAGEWKDSEILKGLIEFEEPTFLDGLDLMFSLSPYSPFNL